MTHEGIVLDAPIEHHTNSVWRVLQTNSGERIRVIMAATGELTRWVATGQRLRVVGPIVEKVWKDGTHPTLSAHHAVEILDMAAAG